MTMRKFTARSQKFSCAQRLLELTFLKEFQVIFCFDENRQIFLTRIVEANITSNVHYHFLHNAAFRNEGIRIK